MGNGTRLSRAERPMRGAEARTFRNSEKTIGFEKYLEEIGSYSPATDMAKIIEISNRYGITFYLYFRVPESRLTQNRR
jgi:hypothetical protein